MSRPSYTAAKGRRTKGVFIPIPVYVVDHPNFIGLTHKAKALLLDLLAQIRVKEGGTKNNGDLTTAYTIMKERGWRSKETLWNARHELEYYGFLVQTRQGHNKKPSLFAITWWAIDECGGKLEVASTTKSSDQWKEVKPKYKAPKRKKSSAPNSSLLHPDNRIQCLENRLNLNKKRECAPTLVPLQHDLCPDNRTPS